METEEVDPASPGRAALRAAYEALSNEEGRSAHDVASTHDAASAHDAASTHDDVPILEPEVEAQMLRDLARGSLLAGAVWFAGGAAVTAGTYAATPPGGSYFLAWGAVLFGGFQLLRGLAAYLQAARGSWKWSELAPVAVLVAVGLAASGWVGLSEASVIGPGADVAGWSRAIASADVRVAEADAIVEEVFARTGSWSSQDSADMTRAAALYDLAAEMLERASSMPDMRWYQDGVVQNFRTAAGVARDFSRLSSSSRQSEFEALGARWSMNRSTFDGLNSRLDQQNAQTKR